jgi:hypothetical protein
LASVARAAPETQPTTKPLSKTERMIHELQVVYAKTYAEPLNSPERLPKEIAIISLSRIYSPESTQKLLEVFKLKDRDPIVWYLAWEALRARIGTLSAEDRRRWATAGLQTANIAGGFPGTTVTPLLRAIAELQPTIYEDQPHKLAIRVLNENSLEVPAQKEALDALRDLVAAWHEPTLVRAIAVAAGRPAVAPRADHVLRGLPNPPEKPSDMHRVTGVWTNWLEKAGLKVATAAELKPYSTKSNVFSAPANITDPTDKRWHAELEIGKLTVSDFDLVWCIDSTGSMNAANQMVAAETGHVVRVCSLVSRRARVGTIYARHEFEKQYLQKCCEEAGSHAGWYQVKGYALSTDFKQLTSKMAAERIPPPDKQNEGNVHPGTPLLGAIQAAVKGMEWSKDKNARRVIVMVGDSPLTPGTDKAAVQFAGQCKKDGYHLHALATARAVTLWEDVFKAAGGEILPFGRGGGGGAARRAMRKGAGSGIAEESSTGVFGELAVTVIKDCVTPAYHDRIEPLVNILMHVATAMEGAEKTLAATLAAK